MTRSNTTAASTRLSGRQSDEERGHVSATGLEPDDRTPARILFIYVMWFFVWFDPDWFAAALGGGPFLVKGYALLFIPVCFLLMKHFRKEVLFWPYLIILMTFFVWMPFVLNQGFLINGLGKVLQYSLLTMVTVAVVKTPQQMVPLLKLFLLQFIWYGIQGLPTAGVQWHQNLSNEDSFGPFMTIGMAYAYYVAIGTSDVKYRYLAFLACFLGVAGTIVSFARGAFIGLCVVFATLAIRSPKKLAFLGYGTVFAVIGLGVILVMFPNGEFWDEMGTITEESNTEGTGLQRWVLWKTAGELFLDSPIFGVGPMNFGPTAAEYFTERGVTNIGSTFDTPGKLYMISLHNDYVQIMVEQGIVGLVVLAAVFVRFFSYLRVLRSDAVRMAWENRGCKFLDSKNLALGLEAAMVGLMVSSVFYPQIFINYWMWSIMMLAFVAATISRRLVSENQYDQDIRSGNT